MGGTRGIRLSGNLMYATVALLGWYGLSSGVYAILTDALLEGLLWLVLTIVLAAVLFRGKTVAEQENREIPLVMWILVALVVSVIGFARLFDLSITDIELFGTVQMPELFRNISSLIYMVLLAVFIWQLIRAYRKPVDQY